MKTKIEVCVESIESALIAERCQADRVELCGALTEGGITPSYGVIKTLRKKLTIKMNVIIRPRRADFCYSNNEFECMKEDVLIAKELGADGLVLGILTPEAKIDKERCKELIEIAAPLPVTIHRAFDKVTDPFEALEDCIEIGATRILTSGLEQKAEEGIPLLKKLIEKANNRIIIMPGSGINSSNIRKIKQETKAKEIHLSAKHRIESRMTYRSKEIPMNNSNPLSEYDLEETSEVLLTTAIKELY